MTKFNVRRIYLILIAWMLVGAIISVYDYLLLNANFSSGVTASYSFAESLILNIGVGGFAALTGGAFIVLYVNEKYRHLSYWKSILLVICSFLVVSLSLVILVSWVESARQSNSSLQLFLVDSMHLKNILVWAIIVAFTQFLIHISDKFGKGVLFNLVSGRYHHPREETRIFMIVDLVSSTHIAEQLERDQYHLFLRDFFSDLTKPILNNKGEIYQYVGDQIVISWKMVGNTLNSSCLKCYFEIQQAITQVGNKYLKRYGLLPEFKAGLHYGKVIAGDWRYQEGHYIFRRCT